MPASVSSLSLRPPGAIRSTEGNRGIARSWSRNAGERDGGDRAELEGPRRVAGRAAAGDRAAAVAELALTRSTTPTVAVAELALTRSTTPTVAIALSSRVLALSPASRGRRSRGGGR
jgi:hypothetical protein